MLERYRGVLQAKLAKHPHIHNLPCKVSKSQKLYFTRFVISITIQELPKLHFKQQNNREMAMGQILKKIEELTGGTCYQTERYSLDHFARPEYQDDGEDFSTSRVHESENKQGRIVSLDVDSYKMPSLFQYFLDGSRRTYKIVDFGTRDGKFLPIVAGQIGTAVCKREKGKLKRHRILRENVIALPDRLSGEYEQIAREIPKMQFPKKGKRKLSIGKVLKYRYQENPDRPFENLAIAKIQTTMMGMEIELIREMVASKVLETNKMLIVDGSLQFSGVEDSDEIFKHVVGVSKSFNPNLRGLLKSSKNKQIGSYLTQLEFGQRTPVFVYEPQNQKGRKRKTKIGAWYLRIRPKNKVKRPLDGIIKLEKIATTRTEKNDFFETDMIDQISLSILLERNVTCYGNDPRWANHLYPIYLTELFLKNSFVSDVFFFNIF